MAKRKKKMFRCPLCNFVSWGSRLENSHYPLELVEVKSDGRGLIKHVFFEWDAKNSLHSVFQRHFYDVLQYLLERRYIDAEVVKNIVSLFDVECLRPVHVHVPMHVHHPVHVHEPKRCDI